MEKIKTYGYNNNYVGQMMLHPMIVSEQQMTIYEVLIHKLKQLREAHDILSTGDLPITLKLPTQLINMLDPVKTELQQTDPAYTLLFLCLYYYYSMKLISLVMML